MCNARHALSKYSTSFSLWSTFLLILPLSSYPGPALSYAVGDLVTRLRLPSHSRTSQLFMNTFCFVTIKAALFLFKTISAIKCCSGWELICFLSRLQLFPEESGLDGQTYVVLKVTVSNPHHICTSRSYPLSIGRYQQTLRLYG